MQEASAEEVAKLITPAADIEKPADKGKDLIGEIPKEINPQNPTLIPVADLMDGAGLVDNDTSSAPSVSADPATNGTAEGAATPATDNTGATPAGEETKRGRGRPRGSRNRPSFADITAAEAIPTDYNQLADVTFDVTTSVMVMGFGEEWKPKNEDEKKAVCGPLAAYLKSKDVKDIPPGLLLAIVVTAYAGPRLRTPETSGKLKLAWQWVKVKVWPGFSNFFRRNKHKQLTLVPKHENTTASGN